MIFTTEDTQAPDGIFSGWGKESDAFSWETQLPGMGVYNRMNSDPALRLEIEGGGGWRKVEDVHGKLIATAPQMYVAELGMYSVASALRNTVGGLSTTVGYLAESITIVQGLFKDPIQDVAMALNVVSDIINSDAFNAAINAIGWIPIVGWIIKILVEVAKIVTNIVTQIGDKNEEEAEKWLAERLTVPAAEWSADADSSLAKYLQRQALAYNLQWMVMPRYPAVDAESFTGTSIEITRNNRNDGFLVYSRDFLNPNLDMPPGMGFVPGTRNLHGAMELRQPGGANLGDIGNFYPTSQALAANVWEQMLKGHPSALAVDTDIAIEAWSQYCMAALEFAMPTEFGGSGIMARGWSLSPTAKFGASTHKCMDEMKGAGQNCDASGDTFYNRMKDIPGDGHTSALIAYYNTLFEYEKKNSGGEWTFDNIDRYSMRPVKALEELRREQEAIIDSLQCMYVDDSAVGIGGGSVPRFAAIGTQNNPGPLHARWAANVQKVFDTGGWEHVNWADVAPHPKGGGRNRVRDNIEVACQSQYGMSADEYFTTRHQWKMTAPPDLVVPENPVPPPAPTPPNYIETAAFIDATGTTRSAGVTRTSAAPLAMAAGIALLLLKGRK